MLATWAIALVLCWYTKRIRQAWRKYTIAVIMECCHLKLKCAHNVDWRRQNEQDLRAMGLRMGDSRGSEQIARKEVGSRFVGGNNR